MARSSALEKVWTARASLFLLPRRSGSSLDTKVTKTRSVLCHIPPQQSILRGSGGRARSSTKEHSSSTSEKFGGKSLRYNGPLTGLSTSFSFWLISWLYLAYLLNGKQMLMTFGRQRSREIFSDVATVRYKQEQDQALYQRTRRERFQDKPGKNIGVFSSVFPSLAGSGLECFC